MPSMQRLLDRAYFLIEENKIRDAALVLDALIQDDPHNIEAWELAMQISSSRAGLEALAERVYWNKDLNSVEKDELLSYLDYMLERLENDRGGEYVVRQSPTGSRSALIIISVIFVLLSALWVIVPEVRGLAPFYFLILFLIVLGFWFWRSDSAGRMGQVRSFSYGIPAARLADA
jgi:hypothetical protein